MSSFAESSRRCSSLANDHRSNVLVGLLTPRLRSALPSHRTSGNGKRIGPIDNVWLQRRGRPGLAPEFPVHRPPSKRPVTNNAIRFNGPNLSERPPGVNQQSKTAVLSLRAPRPPKCLNSHAHRFKRMPARHARKDASSARSVNRIRFPGRALRRTLPYRLADATRPLV